MHGETNSGFNFSAIEIALVQGTLADALRVAIMLSDAAVETVESAKSDADCSTVRPGK